MKQSLFAVVAIAALAQAKLPAQITEYENQINMKAQKCIDALELSTDVQSVAEKFYNPVKVLEFSADQTEGQAINIDSDEQIQEAVRCVRNLIAYDVRHEDDQKQAEDPDFCLECQIQKFLDDEMQTLECPEADFDSDNYFKLSAACKKQMIWEKVTEDDTSMPFIPFEDLADIFDEDMNLSFDHMLDTMPEGRKKLIHPEGAVLKVAFIPKEDVKYTGMFKETQHGIMRISDSSVDPTGQTASPSFGLKFLRDNIHAADAVTLVSFDGQQGYNFFENRFTTSVPISETECVVETFEKKIAEATLFIGAMSVMDWGQYSKDGTEEVNPVWPEHLEFEGVSNFGFTDEKTEDYKETLKGIEAGSVLFNVYAYESSIEKIAHPEGQLIGSIVTTSEVVTSLWGDQQLYFRHGRIDDDLRLKPQWEDYIPVWKTGTLEDTGLTQPMPFAASSCPFSFLWDKLSL